MRSVGRTLVWSLVAAAALAGLQAPPAFAGATCKIVPSWCPPAPGDGGPSSVPEPATVTVLALGAAAAAFAGRRRRK